jgi:hypothetical protein
MPPGRCDPLCRYRVSGLLRRDNEALHTGRSGAGRGRRVSGQSAYGLLNVVTFRRLASPAIPQLFVEPLRPPKLIRAALRFAVPITVSTAATAGRLLVGDFNRDGNLDLAALEQTANTVLILQGLGNGAFTQVQQIPVGELPSGSTVGDFNGDGIADIATANGVSSDVSVLLGTTGPPVGCLSTARVTPSFLRFRLAYFRLGRLW